MDKPPIEEFIKYAETVSKSFISKRGSIRSPELKEEAVQDCYVRALECYDRLKPGQPWKSFLYRNVIGEVLDFERSGRGHAEDKWSLANNHNSIRKRVSIQFDGEDDALGVDEVLGQCGVFCQQQIDTDKINWELLAKLASADQRVLIVGKLLVGFTRTELQPMFNLTRERIGQICDELFNDFDKAEHVGNEWIEQIIFALGLSEEFRMKPVDTGFGWNLPAVDFYETPCQKDEPQLGFGF